MADQPATAGYAASRLRHLACGDGVYSHRKAVIGSTREARCSGRKPATAATVFRQDWAVYAKPAFGGPAQVLRYLGRYTHRVAISNRRLLAFDGERVTFRWKDYAHASKQRKMKLSAWEFLRRFAQHIWPRSFVRIRQSGFLANCCRTANLAVARQLLAITPKPPEACQNSVTDAPAWRCPQCGGTMQIGANLTARQLAQRCKFFDRP
ncbi:MAG TPA: transposase [Bryobacteraceae bacterium]|nr:transposase [Bryobacteraceae bacterium]